MEPQILLYALPAGKADAVAAVCAAQGLRVRTVPPAQYHLTLEQAAGLSPAPPKRRPPSGARLTPMLVCVWLSPEDRDRLLDILRLSGLGAGIRKAVFTATNRHWDAFRLNRALQAEHAALMQKGASSHD